MMLAVFDANPVFRIKLKHIGADEYKGAFIMAQSLFALTYACCIGFVLAGTLASFYQFIANRPVRFMVSVESWLMALASILLCIFAGPFIIMRNALRGRRIEHRPIGWLFGSSAIAGVWSLCSGIVVLNLILAAQSMVS